MTATTGLPPETQAYLDEVREALGDLSPEEREDLLTEVEDSLLEASGDGEQPIAARLGPARVFAAELRASAGLPPAPAGPAPRDAAPLSVREALTAWSAGPAGRRVGRLLADLAPLWWVVRGCVVVGGAALLLDVGPESWTQRLPGLGAWSATLLVLAAAAAASVLLGAAGRRRGHAGPWSVAANIALVLLALPVGAWFLEQSRSLAVGASYVEVLDAAPAGLARDGVPVRNIYPYSRDGEPLFDVLLYDADGTPLDVGADEDDPDRRVPVTRSGERAFNAFPIRYFEPGTTRVADPRAAPPVSPPTLVTPPLEAFVGSDQPPAGSGARRR